MKKIVENIKAITIIDGKESLLVFVFTIIVSLYNHKKSLKICF